MSSALPHRIVTLIRSIKVGRPIEQGLFFVEYIPGEFADVVRKAIDTVAVVRHPDYDACAGQSLYDAIISAQTVGSRLIADVKPQNLLFIFGESAKALVYLPIESPLPHPFPWDGIDELAYGDQQQSGAGQEGDAEPMAVVFCHVRDAEPLSRLCRREEQETQNQTDCYQIFGSELERVQRVLDEVRGHAAIVQQGGAQ
jgi:hypothetical protein